MKREAGLMPDADAGGHIDPDEAFDKLNISRGIADRLQVFSSVFLRLSVYIFLRWIPSRLLTTLVPGLYTIYLLTWTFRQNTVQSTIVDWMSNAQLSSAKDDLKRLGASVSVHPEEGKVVDKFSKNPIEKQVVLHETGKSSRKVGDLSTWQVIKMTILGHSTHSQSANRIAFGLHTMLFLWFLDSLWSPYLFPSHMEHNLQFVRVGALGPKSATLHVRYPFPMGLPEGTNWNAFIEEDAAGGLLRSENDIYSNPEPVRVVYREVYGSGYTSSNSGAGVADEASPLGSTGSIDGRPRSSPKRWERGPLLRLTANEDWTASAKLDGLWPATEYEWRLAFVHNSTFASMPSRSRRFVTWPDPRLSSQKGTVGVSTNINSTAAPLDNPNHFAFATSSCVKPDFPWVPTQFWAWSWLLRLFRVGDEMGGISTRNRIPGFDQLAKSVLIGREQPALRFFLQLGDLIYADVPRFGGPTAPAYRKLYRNLFGSESFRRVYERLPIIGIYDDHEVMNNWGGKELVGKDDEGKDPVFLVKEPESFAPAQQAWKEYIGSANPEALEADENYYTFRYGDTAFFVMDTRKHRTPYQLPDDEAKTMLGYNQRDAYLRWLGAVNDTATFKFVVSSVPFNTLWGGALDWDGKEDSWAAYTHEREDLLNVMQVSH
jgi:alkaline phosphatase D